MGGYGSGRSGGRLTTDNGLTLTLSKLFRDGVFRPGSVGLSRMDEHDNRRADRLDQLRNPSWPGIGARAAALHDHSMGRRAGASRITGSSSRRRHSPLAADGGGSSVRGRAGGRRNSTYRMAPSPSPRAKHTGSPIDRSANPPMTGLCGVLSSCGTSSGQRAASATMSPSLNGCAGQPTTVSSMKSSPPKRSWTPTYVLSSANSIAAWAANFAPLSSTSDQHGTPAVQMDEDSRRLMRGGESRSHRVLKGWALRHDGPLRLRLEGADAATAARRASPGGRRRPSGRRRGRKAR
jgi:hypothetical protein